MSIVLHISWGIWIIFLFLSFIYCCITWHYWSKGHQRNKEEFDLKEKKPLHSSTVFWDLGLLEFMKADGFPVVRKGWEDHTAKGMRCQGRNISSIIPNATAQVLVVYEKGLQKVLRFMFYSCNSISLIHWEMHWARKTGAVPQNYFFYVLVKKSLSIGLMEWGSSGYVIPVIICHNRGWQYRVGLSLDPRCQLCNQKKIYPSICC